MKSKYPITALGKHIEQVLRKNREEGDYAVFSVTNSSGFTKSDEYFNKEVFSKKLNNYNIVYPNEFAYNPSRINVGSIDFLKSESPVLVSPLYFVFKTTTDLDNNYLKFFIRSHFGLVQIGNLTSGSVRDSLKYSALERMKIPLPPLEDQIRIASLLSRIEELIAKRKESIRLLDEFVKSTFLEMFGDPVRNEKGWEKVDIENIGIKIENGWSPNCETYTRVSDNEWAVLKLSSITYRVYNPNEHKVLPEGVKPKEQYEVKKTDLLFSRKNTRDLVGACAYVFHTPRRLLLPDTIFRFNYPINKISPVYLWILFNNKNYSRIIQALASGSAGSMPNISIAKLNKLKFPLPPLKLQNRFAAIVEKVEAITIKYQNSLSEFEKLYGSVSQRAFRGKLV